MKRIITLLVLTACLLASPALAQQEKIHVFDSLVTVHKDGTMTVRESITVTAAGNKIKRGIYRDFPTDYVDEYGNNKTVGFDVLSVTRDGHDEPWHMTNEYSRGLRLYIGDKDVLIDHGRHSYTITYSTNRQIGFFDNRDELYWNVTGNEWDFPIDFAKAHVILPEGAILHDTSGFTGRQGAKGKEYFVERVADNEVTFETTRPLRRHEGMTFGIAWQKGVIDEPGMFQEMIWFFKDNITGMIALFMVVALFMFYLNKWDEVGRDPAKGVVFPRFHPPQKVSPGLATYILNFGLDDSPGQMRAFTAALVNMAVKGYLKIEQVEKKGFLFFGGGSEYRLHMTGDNDHLLTPAERALGHRLFRSNTVLTLEQENHSTIRGAINNFTSKIESENNKAYFVHNSGYIWLGWLVTIVLFMMTGTMDTPLVPVCFVLSLILNVCFYYWMKAPTVTGRQLMDELEGFRMYMATAERDRLDAETPEKMTPEVFEKYLPFAIAFGVEQQWGDKLADTVGAAVVAQYQPDWYSGNTNFRSGSLGDFTSNIGSSLQSSVSSASIDPTSSSGSYGGGGGGGGFSGGGGGGGGGGGW